MKCRTSIFLILGLFSCALIGCSRTVIGGYTDSPDKKYRLYGRVYGAYGRSFFESTTKTVRISIVANDEKESLLFTKDYRVKGFDVGWDVIWKDANNLSLFIYDYGPNVEFSGLQKDEPPRRPIATMTYRFDANRATFTLSP